MAGIFIENALSLLPLPAWIVIIVGGVVVGMAYLFKNYYQNKGSEIETSSTEERLERLFTKPTETTGAKVETFLWNEATDNQKRRVGKVIKINTEKVDISEKKIEDGKKKASPKKVTYSSMTVLTGNKFQILAKIIGYKFIHPLVSNENGNSFIIDSFYLPTEDLDVTDEGLTIEKKSSLYLKNGVWRTKSRETQEVIQELTFLDFHEDVTESFQELADVYSALNVEVQGKKRMLDAKWENISDYKTEKEKQDKKDAMDS